MDMPRSLLTAPLPRPALSSADDGVKLLCPCFCILESAGTGVPPRWRGAPSDLITTPLDSVVAIPLEQAFLLLEAAAGRNPPAIFARLLFSSDAESGARQRDSQQFGLGSGARGFESH